MDIVCAAEEDTVVVDGGGTQIEFNVGTPPAEVVPSTEVRREDKPEALPEVDA